MAKQCESETCEFPQFGGGFCKSHQWMRTDGKAPKPLKRSPIKRKVKPTGELDLFKRIWNSRKPQSELNGKPIFEFDVRCFSHVLPKGSYPGYRLNATNIILLTPGQHDDWHNLSRSQLIEKDWRWLSVLAKYEQLKRKYYQEKVGIDSTD